MRIGRKPTPLVERFWQYVTRTDGCWEWQGHLSPDGYGLIRPDAKQNKVGAHRISWYLHNGKIPDDLWVLHKCDNRCCVNPEHLFLGTVMDNILDMRAKGRDNYTGRPKRCT